MTEKEKMLKGLIYDTSDPELVALRSKAHKLSQKFNLTFCDQFDQRESILKELAINLDEGCYFEGPIFFDYGCFTSFGKNCFANFNFTVLDCAPVTIGDNVLIGPNVGIMTPVHPLNKDERAIRRKSDGTLYDLEYAKPINIGSDVWIAANVVICGGVTIGSNVVIGAGSVVTRDIPSGVLAAGNPCRVIRKLTDDDKLGI